MELGVHYSPPLLPLKIVVYPQIFYVVLFEDGLDLDYEGCLFKAVHAYICNILNIIYTTCAHTKNR